MNPTMQMIIVQYRRRVPMKARNKSIFPAVIALLLALAACQVGSPAPEADTTLPSEGEVTESAPPAEAAAENTAGACANPYLPIITGAAWNYKLTGPIPDTFTRKITAVEADGFTDQDVFDSGVTRTGKWNCENGDLIALSPSGGDSSNVSAEGISVDFQTTALEGVTLPASIKPGDSWSQSLTLEGTQTINGVTYPAINQVNISCNATGTESVTVEAGTFQAMRMECQVTFDITLTIDGNATQNTLTIHNTNWNAENIGLVKTVTTGGGLDSVTELTSYTIP
jgi:hypothetical protein